MQMLCNTPVAVYELQPPFLQVLTEAAADPEDACRRCAAQQARYRPRSQHVIDHFSRVIRSLMNEALALRNASDTLLVRVFYEYSTHHK
jgi:hypothetical protein